jgi:hypothetical protein
MAARRLWWVISRNIATLCSLDAVLTDGVTFSGGRVAIPLFKL